MWAEFAARPGIALVTGGTGAIGTAVCGLLAKRGSAVAFTYRSNAAAAEALAAELAAVGVVAEPLGVDLADPQAVAGRITALCTKFGAIHPWCTPPARTSRWCTRCQYGGRLRSSTW